MGHFANKTKVRTEAEVESQLISTRTVRVDNVLRSSFIASSPPAVVTFLHLVDHLQLYCSLYSLSETIHCPRYYLTTRHFLAHTASPKEEGARADWNVNPGQNNPSVPLFADLFFLTNACDSPMATPTPDRVKVQ